VQQDKVKLHDRFQNWTDEDLRIALEDARLFGTEKLLIALELVRRKEKEGVNA
jgi:hypothetical protein